MVRCGLLVVFSVVCLSGCIPVRQPDGSFREEFDWSTLGTVVKDATVAAVEASPSAASGPVGWLEIVGAAAGAGALSYLGIRNRAKRMEQVVTEAATTVRNGPAKGPA